MVIDDFDLEFTMGKRCTLLWMRVERQGAAKAGIWKQVSPPGILLLQSGPLWSWTCQISFQQFLTESTLHRIKSYTLLVCVKITKITSSAQKNGFLSHRETCYLHCINIAWNLFSLEILIGILLLLRFHTPPCWSNKQGPALILTLLSPKYNERSYLHASSIFCAWVFVQLHPLVWYHATGDPVTK